MAWKISDLTNQTPSDTYIFEMEDPNVDNYKTTWSTIKTTMKTYLDSFFWNPDFYKYQIIPTVNSWNLTVDLKNYAWSTPSTSAPIKVQIWNSVYTVTSALSVSAPALWNRLASWTATAWSIVDFFVFAQYNTTTLWVNLLFTRIPKWATLGDFVNSDANEKWAVWIINYNTSDNIAYLWRFSASLSAGLSWSLSWAWLSSANVINKPIDRTDVRDWTTTYTWFSVDPIDTTKYQIIWNKCRIFNSTAWSAWTSNATDFTFTLPIASAYSSYNDVCMITDNSANQSTPWHLELSWSTANVYKTFYGWTFTNSWWKKAYYSIEYFI